MWSNGEPAPLFRALWCPSCAFPPYHIWGTQTQKAACMRCLFASPPVYRGQVLASLSCFHLSASGHRCQHPCRLQRSHCCLSDRGGQQVPSLCHSHQNALCGCRCICWCLSASRLHQTCRLSARKEVSKSQPVLGNGSQTSSSLHVRTAHIPTAGTNGLLAAQCAHQMGELILTVVPVLPGSFPSMRP